jgi:CRP/FNR family cyclic AMP-dependent transcriptional regulator
MSQTASKTSKDAERIAGLLSDYPLFSDLSFNELLHIAVRLEVRVFEPDVVIFSEGEAGDYLCLLLSGKVEITKNGEHGVKHLMTVSRGKSIGEMALVDREPRSASCRCIEAAEVALLGREKFESLAADYPALAYKMTLRIARMLSQRLRQTTGLLTDHLDH